MIRRIGANIHNPRSALLIVGLCLLSVCQSATDAAGAYGLSHGRKVILDRGLQIQSLVYVDETFTSIDRWLSSNATTFNFFEWANGNVLGSKKMPVSQQWSRLYHTGIPASKYLYSCEVPYVNNFVSMGYSDEVEDFMTESRQDDMSACYREWNTRYPNALAYANFNGGHTSGELAAYMQATQPDMIMFDHYRPNYSTRESWYATMQQYRTLGLAGNDGTGQTPIPYAQHLTMYRSSPTLPLFSESFVKLQNFASWAFGYTFVNDFVYKDAPGAPSQLFSTPDDSSPTAVFNYVAKVNRESRHLGPALVRLVSTDLRMIPGKVTGVENGSVSSISPWAKGAGGDNYITAITPLGKDRANPSTTNYSDVLIGYFQPLLENNVGCTFADGLHFMIVNGRGGSDAELYGPGNSAAALAEWYRLDFDFGTSGYNSLVRLSRDTGKVELVSLQRLAGGDGALYRLDLKLEGGTGDLFGFWNSSNPLPTVPALGALTLLETGMIGLHAYARRIGR